MTYQRERDEFMQIMGAEGIRADVARKLLRYSTTLHRLAEAQCNGDWPADNGERKVEPCARCESRWVRSRMVRVPGEPAIPGLRLLCPDCRTSDLAMAFAKTHGLGVVFQGDPRGCVFKVTVPSGRTNDGAREGICVPVRSR